MIYSLYQISNMPEASKMRIIFPSLKNDHLPNVRCTVSQAISWNCNLGLLIIWGIKLLFSLLFTRIFYKQQLFYK